MVEVHTHITGSDVPLDQPLIDPDGNIIPSYFDPRLLTVLKRTEVSWWDETRPDTKIGTDKIKKVKNEEVQVIFSWNNMEELSARVKRVSIAKIVM